MFVERHKEYVDHPVMPMRAMIRARLRERKQRGWTLKGGPHIRMRDRFKHELKKKVNKRKDIAAQTLTANTARPKNQNWIAISDCSSRWLWFRLGGGIR
jgi:hypothetical protein